MVRAETMLEAEVDTIMKAVKTIKNLSLRELFINYKSVTRPKKLMEDCIFCKIVAGNIPASKIYEDESFMAFLDIKPNTRGMTLVIPKTHHDSYIFDMPSKEYQGLMEATQRVVRILEKGLGVVRVAMVMEGMGVNHAHIKLYPLHGVTEKFEEMWASDKVFFDKYEGYISTQLGPDADMSELSRLAEEIKQKSSASQ